MIVASRTDVHTLCHEQHAEDVATISQLQADLGHVRMLLAEAIRSREGLVNANLGLFRKSRHFYVDNGGYCAACNLPKRNARHCERAA